MDHVFVPSALFGGGDVGDLIRAKDWTASALGPIETWPHALRSTVQTIIYSPVPMVVLWGPEGTLVYNQGYAEVCGPRHPAALGGNVLEVWPEARAFNQNVITAGLRGEPLRFDAQELELWRNGAPERVWMDLAYTPIRDDDGRPVGTLAMVFDITARVMAERRLAESEGLYRFLDRLGQAAASRQQADEVLAVTTEMVATHLGVTNCAYADMDPDGDGFTIRGDWHAPGSPSIVGHYNLADFGARAVADLSAGRPLVIEDATAELAPQEAASFHALGIVATLCMPLVKDGRLRALMAIHDRVPHAWTDHELAVIREVTERSWAHVERVGAEARLRAREEQLRLAVDAAEIGLWDVDVVGDTLFWPPRLKAMFGISPDVPVSLADFYAGLHPEDFTATVAAFAAAADPQRRSLYDVEYRAIGKEDGVVRWVAAKGRAIFRDEQCVRIIGTAIDITQRKATEQSLRELNETLERRVVEGLAERKLLAAVVENTNAIVFVADLAFQLLAVNRAGEVAFERLFGTRPQVGASILATLEHLPEHQAQVRALWSRALAGEEFTIFEEFGDPSRERRHFEINFNVLRDASGQRIGAYQIAHDVTDRMMEQRRLAEAEEQLRQTQKVEALGQLTGGVAHDFNNLLTPIIGSLDILLRRQIGGEREKRLIDGALQSAERARILVQRLLAFARRQPLHPTAIDIRVLITGMGELIDSTSGPQVDVVIEAPDGLPAAWADYNQIEMALLNLSVNARDAMPDGGTLRISAGVDEIPAAPHAPLPPGSYVRITVSDTGFGMDEETLARAIEPFYSTKGIGKGTGLGLSMVHGLTRQLGGGMRLSSRPGEGTSVELWIPTAGTAARPAAQGALAPRSAIVSSARADRGIALLVDDEDAVRASAANMLEECGFSVLPAGSAEEALGFLRSDCRIDLLVTDHLMPGMDGTQLVRTARRLRPHLPSLIVSGYADVDAIASDLPWLNKPFRVAELSDALWRFGMRIEPRAAALPGSAAILGRAATAGGRG